MGLVLGRDVQEVERLLHRLGIVGLGESGGVAFDGDKVVLEETVDATLLADLLQGGAVLGDTKHGWQAGGKVDRDGRVRWSIGSKDAGRFPGIGCEPHDLLGCTGTLHHASRLSEDGMTGLEALDSAVSLVAVSVIVDGRDEGVGVCKCLIETLDAGIVAYCLKKTCTRRADCRIQ